MKQDIYQTYISAKGVAFVWIGAAIGPSFFVIGLELEYRIHLIISIACCVLTILTIFDGTRALKAKSWSGVIAFAIVPFALLLAGVLLQLCRSVNQCAFFQQGAQAGQSTECFGPYLSVRAIEKYGSNQVV